jgi:predicted histidine transporter YuiF (NhaC family)
MYAVLAVLFWLLYAFDTHNLLPVAMAFTLAAIVVPPLWKLARLP